MKLKITLTAVSLLLISSLFAQSEYKKSIGVRVVTAIMMLYLLPTKHLFLKKVPLK